MRHCVDIKVSVKATDDEGKEVSGTITMRADVRKLPWPDQRWEGNLDQAYLSLRDGFNDSIEVREVLSSTVVDEEGAKCTEELEERISFLEYLGDYRSWSESLELEKLRRLLHVRSRPASAVEKGRELIERIARLEQESRQLRDLQSFHLEALRRVSEAMGHPYKGDLTKTCVDLADLAAIKIKSGMDYQAKVARPEAPVDDDKESFQYTDEAVRLRIQGSGYVRQRLENFFYTYSTAEKWSLYRAIAKLAFAARAAEPGKEQG